MLRVETSSGKARFKQTNKRNPTPHAPVAVVNAIYLRTVYNFADLAASFATPLHSTTVPL